MFRSRLSCVRFFLCELRLVRFLLLDGCCWLPKQGDLVLKKATEYGAVEIWMNERLRRACANSCAEFVYGFLEVFLPLYGHR